ncbi:MAG: pilus assembly protein PilO [Betaproteobacteria bacterium]|nr:pilus assembly protein PilO [Betaproteobacteria bacterium]
MTFDELNRLNPKEIGSWPVLPKLGALLAVFLLIVGWGYWFDWANQWNEFTSARNKEAELRASFLDKKRQDINLDAYTKQLRDIEQSFGAMLKQLPNKAEMEALLSDINQAGLGRGLQFDLFRPAEKEILYDFYAELPITIKVSGNYHDVGFFTSDVAQLPRIVTLNNVSMVTDKEGRLVMEAVARTFRYLDEEEMMAQRQAAKDKTAKKGTK